MAETTLRGHFTSLLSSMGMKTSNQGHIVSVRSHDYDIGEKLVPPYWRSEICHATLHVF